MLLGLCLVLLYASCCHAALLGSHKVDRANRGIPEVLKARSPQGRPRGGSNSAPGHDLWPNQPPASKYLRSTSIVAQSKPSSTGHMIIRPSTPPKSWNGDSMQALIPSMDTEHWYSSDHQYGAMKARLALNHHYLTIALDHSAFVDNVVCSDNSTITGSFTGSDAFTLAEQHWTGDDDLVFITSAPTCSSDGQNAFFLASSASFNAAGQSFRIMAQKKSFQDVCAEMHLDFGYEEPGTSTSYAASTPSAAAATSLYATSTTSTGLSAPTTSASLSETTSSPSSSVGSTPTSTNSNVPSSAAASSYSTLGSSVPSSTTASAPVSIATTGPAFSSGTEAATSQGTLTGLGGTLTVASGSDQNASATAIDSAPPEATIDGLPAIAPGPDFDQRLDDLLGYYSQDVYDENTVLAEASGLGISARDLAKRGFFDFISNVVSNVVDNLKQVVSNVVSDIQTFVTVATDAVQVAYNTAVALVQVIATGQYSAEIDHSFSSAPDGEGDCDFGSNCYLLYSTIGATGDEGFDLYCVSCSASGDIKLVGTIAATLSSGVTQASFSATGDLDVELFLGLDAFATYDYSQERDLKVVSLGGWKIPGIVALAPEAVLSSLIAVHIAASGRIYSGASLTWPNIVASVDLVNTQNSQFTGFTPNVSPVFQASGQIEVDVTLALPVTLSFALEILPGSNYQKIYSVNLTDTPAVAASALYDSTASDGCSGVAYDVAFQNNLEVDTSLFGVYQLSNYNQDLGQGCYTIGAKERRTIGQRQNDEDADVNGTAAYPVVAATVGDPSGQVTMHPHYNGNLFLAQQGQASNLTLVTGDTQMMVMSPSDQLNIVYGDSAGRIMHYYPDTLASLGVSRLRLATWDNLPHGSRIVTLAPVVINGTEFLTGVDAQGQQSWLMCCGIDDQPNRMFLASDWQAAPAILQSPGMQYIVTGGVATDCIPLAFTATS
ncbi:hypothetical protein BAUCODRAFT_28714 [Baudoinia panamericana UAMH 10762]|uniref:DUF7029 domain-containing protein n=1 Tax=Baudoinia panamericana (strain UAMH 10762) TaxID=717646 RepID=M2N899_BAUPA|nr:uncharacterized protein BAUCODRAFT_28714 [Baudoinia panamericana UAMH 10762]EMD00364.1 hypothetical protein BAUCODRAFT_28714 [Baudoinia panamericana UAMH 10762]